jgi:ferredoxin-NADP reductase
MWEFETQFSEIIRQTPDIKTFRFTVEDRDGIDYNAGQFFYVTIKISGVEAVHHFTLSSSPTETAQKGYIEFTKRITPSEYSQALDRMKPGDWAKVQGPEGEFCLPERDSKLAFVSGGIGITPLRSMLRYTVDEALGHDVVLIYGNNDLDNIAFRDELESMARASGRIRVEYVLSGPKFPANWKGKTGFITKDIVTDLIGDCKERTFYVSGPLKMVLSLEEQLAAAGIPEAQVRRDYFPGYD